MSTVTNNTTSNPLASGATSSSSTSTSTTGSASTNTPTSTAQTFLKLLVAQMQNQDPTNPMDNSQLTSQMAQINTVTQLDTLNTSITGLSTQFTQMQAIQGSALVGKDVIVPGNQLSVTSGTGAGGFTLTTPADDVKVDILDASKKVVDTIDMGKQAAGQNSFSWDASKVTDTTGYTFNVTATAAGKTLTSVTSLMKDTVVAINTSGSTLTLELAKSGDVPYTQVQALN